MPSVASAYKCVLRMFASTMEVIARSARRASNVTSASDAAAARRLRTLSAINRPDRALATWSAESPTWQLAIGV